MIEIRRARRPRLRRPRLAALLSFVLVRRLLGPAARRVRRAARHQRGSRGAGRGLSDARPPRHGDRELRARGRTRAQGFDRHELRHPAGRRAAHERGQRRHGTASSTIRQTSRSTSCRSGSSRTCSGIDPGLRAEVFRARRRSAAGCGSWRRPTAPTVRSRIRQDARLYAGLFDGPERGSLEVAAGRRIYVHVARGKVTVNGETLAAGDALKLTDTTAARPVGRRGRGSAGLRPAGLRPAPVAERQRGGSPTCTRSTIRPAPPAWSCTSRCSRSARRIGSRLVDFDKDAQHGADVPAPQSARPGAHARDRRQAVLRIRGAAHDPRRASPGGEARAAAGQRAAAPTGTSGSRSSPTRSGPPTVTGSIRRISARTSIRRRCAKRCAGRSRTHGRSWTRISRPTARTCWAPSSRAWTCWRSCTCAGRATCRRPATEWPALRQVRGPHARATELGATLRDRGPDGVARLRPAAGGPASGRVRRSRSDADPAPRARAPAQVERAAEQDHVDEQREPARRRRRGRAAAGRRTIPVPARTTACTRAARTRPRRAPGRSPRESARRPRRAARSRSRG